jgi:hypothetical protein
MRTIMQPKIANAIANIPDDEGIGRSGAVAATATAFHADAEGAENMQVPAKSASRTQG